MTLKKNTRRIAASGAVAAIAAIGFAGAAQAVSTPVNGDDPGRWPPPP